MKKILSLAVAAALVAPLAAAANPTLYGRVTVSLAHEDLDGLDSAWNVQDNASRIGVKGSEDLGNGLSAIYQFEFSVDASDSGNLGGRLAYAGLTGGFGTFAMGRQWTPYYNTVDKTDIMESGFSNDYYLGLSRVGNAVAYVTPNFNGLSGAVALVVDNGGDEDTGEDFADWTNVSVDYSNGPLSVGGSWLRENNGEGDLWGLAASYNFGMFSIIGQYEDAESDFTGADDQTSWALGGEVYFGNNTVRGVYANVDAGYDGDATSWILGVDHAFSQRTKVFAEYMDTELAYSDRLKGYTDGQYFGVGIRHDF
ncbi:MAG: porin [Gammaproteobacteria bacterium]|nr:porin [Gammaproteobacteria bacterium]